MSTAAKIKWARYIVSALVLIFGFLFFYNDTHEMMGSLFAASLSAALTFCSCLMLGWLIQVFIK